MQETKVETQEGFVFLFIYCKTTALRRQKCKIILGNSAGAGKLLDLGQAMRSGGVSLIPMSGRGLLMFSDPSSLKPTRSPSPYCTSIELEAPMVS